MKNNLIRLIMFILISGFVIFMFIQDQFYPLERASVANLRIGYYSQKEGWIFSGPVPTSERELQVCGLMKKSRQAELLFTITNPNEINEFLKVDKFFFDVQPGDFCVRLNLLGTPPPGKYTLWVMDARHSVGKVSVEFRDE